MKKVKKTDFREVVSLVESLGRINAKFKVIFVGNPETPAWIVAYKATRKIA